MGRTGYVDAGELSFAGRLAAATDAICGELEGFFGAADLRQWVPYPEPEYYEGMWQVLGLIAAGRTNEPALARCPTINDMLREVPDLRQAHFSALFPGARILPHRGAEGVLRVALVLMASPECAGWRVDGQTRIARPGEVVVFDDGSEHAAWNDGELARITLLFDTPDPSLAPDARARLLRAYDAEVAAGAAARERSH